MLTKVKKNIKVEENRFYVMVSAIDWMCTPKINILKPNLQCDGTWRWELWEVIRS